MNDRKSTPQFISVPFKAESSNGMMNYYGIAKFSPAGIVVEFESKFLDMIKNDDVKEIRISLDEIFDIRFRKGIYKFFSQIQIRLKNFTKLSELPNSSGKVKLNIKREDFEFAQTAVELILQCINGDTPQTLPEANDSNQQLPPVQTSVSELFDTNKLNGEDSRKTNKLT